MKWDMENKEGEKREEEKEKAKEGEDRGTGSQREVIIRG